MKILSKSLAGVALCSIALTGCGSDKKDKVEKPPAVKTTPTQAPTNSNSITPTSTEDSNSNIHSVTSGESNPSTGNRTPNSTVNKSSNGGKAIPSSSSSSPKVTATNNFFKNTKGVIWASSGDFTNKKLKNKVSYNYKKLDKGLYTIDVNCSGGSAKLVVNGNKPFNVKCTGSSDDNILNACLKSKSDVNSSLEAANDKVKYIWQMRKISGNC